MSIPRVAAFSVACAAGTGQRALAAALASNVTAVVPNRVSSRPLATYVGAVADVDDVILPRELRRLDCRNNRLAALGLAADDFQSHVRRVVQRYGAERVGLALGTSTSSIGATEAVYRSLPASGMVAASSKEPRLHTIHSPSLYVQAALGLGGPVTTVSTACSSSAKVFGIARRWLSQGLADAVVVGGVDSLCDSVLFGFHALQLLSPEPCRPFDVERCGLSLGEAAGFALLTLEPLGDDEPGLGLFGVGESSDAHHMSSPHPQGLGAQQALSQALQQAQWAPADVDYLNLHGTATRRNDEVEARLVAENFPAELHASSTKGVTGHTLGAAGIVEAVICLNAMQNGLRPGTASTHELDPLCGPQVRLQPRMAPVQRTLSHSFGFGGSNCVLAFGHLQ